MICSRSTPNNLPAPCLLGDMATRSATRTATAIATADVRYMRRALALARRALGLTSPNPMVGAVLVKRGRAIGEGWHTRAGEAHAEPKAILDAQSRGHSPAGATLYVTLEPCCTHGRTPPCTELLIRSGVKRVIVGATDPNPKHAGRGFAVLRRAGIEVIHGVLAAECARLNAAFNHWIVRGTPLVTVKAAMTLDGKMATASGESKWITGEAARREGHRLRLAADAVLVGIETVLADDPALTVRLPRARENTLRRIILDSRARTPLAAKIVSDEMSQLTTIVVTRDAPARRVAALSRRVRVLEAPATADGVDLRWLLKRLGKEDVTSLLVEGGGTVNAAFLLGGLAQRVAFFYAPKIIGGRDAHKAVAGVGASNLKEALCLRDVRWRKLGPDLMLTACLAAV